MKWLLILSIAAASLAAQATTVTTVATFPANTPGQVSLIQGADGNFYGTTTPLAEAGTIFEMTPAGALTTLYTFQINSSSLVQGRDGNFYLTTPTGGTSKCFYGGNVSVGCGTIFTVTPAGSATTLYTFTGAADGGQPNPTLIQATDGNFYGTTTFGGAGCTSGVNQGATGCGTIFRITSGGQLTTIYRFGASTASGAPPDGANPVGGLIQASDGYLYGTTEYGGNGEPYQCSAPLSTGSAAGCGTIFKVSTGGSLTTLYTFGAAPDAAKPTTSLIQAADGNFYGTSGIGGTVFPSAGTLFKMTPAGALTVLHSFGSVANDAVGPAGNLVQAGDGNLYGSAQGGVNNYGALYNLTPSSGVESVVYSFPAASINTPGPNGLTLASDGSMYGTTTSEYGGGPGTVFRLTLPVSDVPAIASTNGVLNGASFQPGIAPDTWITINGTNLSTKTDTWNNSIVKGALPTTLDGVSVMVGDQAAYIEYVSATQINALAPTVPPGTVPITVTTSNGTSPAVMTQLSAEQPAFFQWGTYAVATRQNFSLAVKNGTFPGTTTVPAKPGDVIILWGTGFGPTSPSAPAGLETPATTTYNTATTVTVMVGKAKATVYGAALAPGYAGLYQVAIQVPQLSNGDYPVIATINGAQSLSTTMLTVQQ